MSAEVVSLQDKSKDDRIKELEDKLREYELEETISSYSDSINDKLRMIVQEMFRCLHEDPDTTISNLKNLDNKLEKALSD